MKKLSLLLLLCLLPAEAGAISRYVSTSLSCERVRGIIRTEGAVILRWQSRRVSGLPRFDRFVADDRFCRSDEYADLTVVPTADNEQCRVQVCERRINDDDNIFRRRR